MNWEFFSLEIRSLSNKIKKFDEYKPNVIVGVVRGGIIPARILSTELNIKEVYCLNVSKKATERKVVTEILEDLVGKNILLVEDVLETGLSMIAAKKYLENKGARVKTASLYITENSIITPDFYLNRVEFPFTFSFPWE